MYFSLQRNYRPTFRRPSPLFVRRRRRRSVLSGNHLDEAIDASGKQYFGHFFYETPNALVPNVEIRTSRRRTANSTRRVRYKYPAKYIETDGKTLRILRIYRGRDSRSQCVVVGRATFKERRGKKEKFQEEFYYNPWPPQNRPPYQRVHILRGRRGLSNYSFYKNILRTRDTYVRGIPQTLPI